MVRPPGSRADVSVSAGALRAFLDLLAGHCRDLPADALTSMGRVVERKLWEIDRAGVHAVTGGSDDLYPLLRIGRYVAMLKPALRLRACTCNVDDHEIPAGRPVAIT